MFEHVVASIAVGLPKKIRRKKKKTKNFAVCQLGARHWESLPSAGVRALGKKII